MLGRDEADRFVLSKAAGTVYDLDLVFYDAIFFELPNPKPERQGQRLVLMLKCVGRSKYGVDISNGVIITIDASTDFAPLETAVTRLRSCLQEIGLETFELVKPKEIACIELKYTNQLKERVDTWFSVYATTGEELDGADLFSFNIENDVDKWTVINESWDFILDISNSDLQKLAAQIKDYYVDYNNGMRIL